MKNKKNLLMGLAVLLVLGGMNIAHALDGYGFLNGSLCQNVWAQSSSSGGSSSGSSSSSSSSGSSSSGTSSTDKGGNKFKKTTETTESRINGAVYKESEVTSCKENGDSDCKSGARYRQKKEDGSWDEWIPVEI